STCSSTATSGSTSPGSASRTRASTSEPSRSSRSRSWTRPSRSPATAESRLSWQRYSRRMSHLDELDEFEAELELRLKKEYTAVFGLFRYCVLTQDATYLCNKLELKYVSPPSYA